MPTFTPSPYRTVMDLLLQYAYRNPLSLPYRYGTPIVVEKLLHPTNAHVSTDDVASFEHLSKIYSVLSLSILSPHLLVVSEENDEASRPLPPIRRRVTRKVEKRKLENNTTPSPK